MAVDIAHDTHRHVAVLYCNTTDMAFGPVFTGPGCDQDAADFLDWLKRHAPADPIELHNHMLAGDGSDARDYTDRGLERAYWRWTQASDRYRGVEA